MLRNFAAAVAAAPLLALLPMAGFAATSENQEGSFVVPYACSVSPVSAAMTPIGTNANGSGPQVYSQNSDTIYGLAPLQFAGPLGVNNAAYSGAIAMRNPGGTTIVANASSSASAAGNVGGLANATGATNFTFSTSEAAFRAGNYSVASTLSCAQNID